MDGEEKKDQNQGAENQSGGEPLETTGQPQESAAPQPSGSLDVGPAPVVETTNEDELNKPAVVDPAPQSVSGSGSNQLRTLLIVLVLVLVIGVGGIVAWQTLFS